METLLTQTIEETPLNSGFAVNLMNEIRNRWSGWLVFTFAALNVLLILAQIFGWIDLEQTAWFGDISTTALMFGAFVLAWRVTRHPLLDESTKKAWEMLMLAFFAYACGEGLWLFFSKFLEIEPFPSWADVGYLSFYPLMLWALLRFPTVQEYSRSDKSTLTMDVAIVMLGTSTVVWHFIIAPTLASVTEEEWLKPTLALSYIVGDIVMLLGVATVLLRGVAESSRRTMFIIVAGLIAFAASDLVFAYLTLQDTYYSGHWIDNFWAVGDFALLYSAHYKFRKISETAVVEELVDRKAIVQPFSWLPYSAVVLGCGMLLYETRPYWSEPLGLIVFASLGITALVVFRQIAAVKENVRLLGEQEKRQSELKFKTLVEHSSDLITIRDKSDKVIFRSPSVKNILGYELDEIDKFDSFELIHPDDVENLVASLKELGTGNAEVFRQEYRIKHKDGSWRVMEGFAKKVDDDEGDLHGVIVNSRDITKRKLDEEKLRVYMAKLERSNRELQDFAYVASHDLQEPLRKVQAFGDRLEKKYAESLADEARDYIRRMRDASARMQTLINDLLTFSRVSTKAQPFSQLDLTKITKEVVSDLEVRIEQTKAKIEIGAMPEIDADAVQMRQLLQNLIGNALKFQRAEESPVVKIYAENFTETGASFQIDNEELLAASTGFKANGADTKVCRLIVEDNGIGFEEKYLDRIFTVFQRLHGRSDYEGSGVGLAVCRKIVERHNGEITAESAPDKGAKFIVTLPLKQTEGDFI